MATLFFSYAHEDERYRDKLEKHLAMLKRQGRIEMWHDRRITPGQHIDRVIDQHLETADIILLLISADFLASDYCYDVEVRRAVERHERGQATVIPIILRPCDWHGAPFGRLLALPKDGIPISTWSDPDEAFLDVANGIKLALDRPKAPVPVNPSLSPAPDQTPSRPLPPLLGDTRIARRFSQLEKDDFLDEAFAHVASFFEASLAELSRVNKEVQTRFRRLDAARFTAVAYREGRPVSRCTIWRASRSGLVGGIGYVENDSGDTNSFNENISVEADPASLYLKGMGMSFVGQRPPQKMTSRDASHYLWDLFLRRLRELG